MLDCANGYEEENQEEIDELKEGFPQESESDKEADAEDANREEINKEGIRSAQSCRKKEKLEEENDERDNRACEQ
jgi:hypothetical protein